MYQYPKDFKYIMVDGIYPILFTLAMIHKDIAKGHNVTSAGFAKIESCDNKLSVSVSGESVSLGISHNPEDASTIKKMFVEMY